MNDQDKMVRVFYSYSHKDEDYRGQLENHLSLLRRRGIISEWHFRKIPPGREWERQINDEIDSTDLFLLLVSSDFLASDYCWDVELERALEKRAQGRAEVIPIILRAVDYEGSPIAALQVLPVDGRPISQWEDVDEAWLGVAQGIRGVCETLCQLSGKEEVEEDAAEPTSEEDFGYLDFSAEVEIAMEVALGSQHALTDHTGALRLAIQDKTERLTALQLSDAPNTAYQARKIAGSMAADLNEYAINLEGIAENLSESWTRVDRYFPRLMESSLEMNPDQEDDLVVLRQTLQESSRSCHGLQESLSEAGSQLEPLARLSATLKLAGTRARRALTKVSDSYWQIENSLTQMVVRVDAWLRQASNVQTVEIGSFDEDILVALTRSETDRLQAEELATACGINRHRVQHHLARLTEAGHIDLETDINGVAHFAISAKGRAHLIARGLL